MFDSQHFFYGKPASEPRGKPRSYLVQAGNIAKTEFWLRAHTREGSRPVEDDADFGGLQTGLASTMLNGVFVFVILVKENPEA